MSTHDDDVFKYYMYRKDHIEAKKDISSIFAEFFEKKGLLTTYSIA